MSPSEFRKINDQITYYGTLDDVVFRYPWGQGEFGQTLDLHAIQSQLVTAALYDKTVILNDGYLIANQLLLPDLDVPSSSLIGSMLKGRFAFIYGRGGDMQLVEGVERTAKNGAGVRTHAAIMSDSNRWEKLKHGLRELEDYTRGRIIAWPHDKNMGHVFYLLMRSIRDKSGELTQTSVPDHLRADFDVIFKCFENQLDANFDQARTIWEEQAWIHFLGRDIDGTTLGTGNFTVEELRSYPVYRSIRVMMNIANEMYHLAQTAGVGRSLELSKQHVLASDQRHIGVATALVADHEGLIAPREPVRDGGTYRALNQLMLSIPPNVRFTRDFSFVEKFQTWEVKEAREQYLENLWLFANGRATFDNGIKARDRYAKQLARVLLGSVKGPRIFRYVEQLSELIIGFATSPLTPIQSWFVGIGKDSLKNQLIERVSRQALEVSLMKEGIAAAQDQSMLRNQGLYIGPLNETGLKRLLENVGPHPKAVKP